MARTAVTADGRRTVMAIRREALIAGAEECPTVMAHPTQSRSPRDALAVERIKSGRAGREMRPPGGQSARWLPTLDNRAKGHGNGPGPRDSGLWAGRPINVSAAQVLARGQRSSGDRPTHVRSPVRPPRPADVLSCGIHHRTRPTCGPNWTAPSAAAAVRFALAVFVEDSHLVRLFVRRCVASAATSPAPRILGRSRSVVGSRRPERR
jgi:hypothetical protein